MRKGLKKVLDPVLNLCLECAMFKESQMWTIEKIGKGAKAGKFAVKTPRGVVFAYYTLKCTAVEEAKFMTMGAVAKACVIANTGCTGA